MMKQLSTWIFWLLLIIVQNSVFSLPTYPQVLDGEVAFHQEDRTLHIYVISNAILDWQEFSIDASEELYIHFTEGSDYLLNFTRSQISKISGNIYANGSFLLANPSGIYLEDGSVINAKKVALNSLNGLLQYQGSIKSESGYAALLGRAVSLGDAARIDVSGKNSGGLAFVGGGWRGEDANLPNSEFVVVNKGAKIFADAIEEGNGGEIVIWSNQSTQFLGSLSAKGSKTATDGGMAEVSSAGHLLFDGKVDLSSPNGVDGNLLLDPLSITIQAASPDINGNGGGLDITNINQLNNALTTPVGFTTANSIITSGAVSGLLTGATSMTLAAVNFITLETGSQITAGAAFTGQLILEAPIVNLKSFITSSDGITPLPTLTGSGANTVNLSLGGSIQNAIDVAAPGGTVNIGAGTFIQEAEVISKDLTIIGAGQNATIIQAPPPSTHLTQKFVFGGFNWWCILMVDNQAAPVSQTVNISDLTVDGDNQQDAIPNYGSSDRFFAIGYHNANGTVNNVHTTNTKQSTNFTELAGGGIANASNIVAPGFAVTFNVTNSLIDFYQRIGIDCRGDALTANISNSTIDRGYILPPSPPATATPNGIQYSGNTTGTITNNLVTTNIAAVPLAGASGIILFGAGPNIVVSGNTVNNADNGIISINTGNNLQINNNTVNFTIPPGPNDPEGIVVADTNGLTTIKSNVMNNIPFINMELFSSTNQPFQLMGNQFIGSQTGMLVEGSGTMGPQITMNSDSFVGTAGFYIEEATGLLGAPNDIWPSTASVTFDGLMSGFMTFAQFQQVLTKIFDKHNDPALGLVLDFIPPSNPSPPIDFRGTVKKNRYLNTSEYVLRAKWNPSPSSNVVFYRIYKNGKIVDEVLASSPLVFETCLHSKSTAKRFEIAAVNSLGLESIHIKIRIKND